MAGLTAGGGSCAPSLIGSVEWIVTFRAGAGLSGAPSPFLCYEV